MILVEGKWRCSEEEKQLKREQNKRLVWITNGIESKRHDCSLPIPETWYKGRTKNDVRGLIKGVSNLNHTLEANKKRSLALQGRPSPNKGNTSPKKGLTEIEFYGEEKALELAKNRSDVHTGKTPWNLGIPHTELVKAKIGAANESSERRASAKYRRWSFSVLDRDKHTCQHCGTKKHRFGDDELLYSHHIKGWEEFIELRFMLDNGLTLCNSCHPRLENTFRVLRKNNFFPPTMILNTEGDGVEICSTCHRLINKSEIPNITSCSCNISNKRIS
jgi:hypothetical protein